MKNVWMNGLIVAGLLFMVGCGKSKREQVNTPHIEQGVQTVKPTDRSVPSAAANVKVVKPTVSPAQAQTNRVQKLLDEGSDDKFEQTYIMDLYLGKVAEIRRDVPTFLQEKRIQELAPITNTTHTSEVDARWAELRPMLIFKPATEILEIRQEGAYVKMTYASVDRAPLAYPPYVRGQDDSEVPNSYLKEAVCLLQISQDGRLQRLSRTMESDIYWNPAPFNITGVHLNGSAEDLWVNVATVGGVPSTNSKMQIGSYAVKPKDFSKHQKHLFVRVFRALPSAIRTQTNTLVRLSVTSDAGQTDSVEFTIPALDNHTQIYVREPWLSALTWNEDIRPLRAADASALASAEARYEEARTEKKQIGTFENVDSAAGSRTEGGVVVTDVSVRGTYEVARGKPIFFMDILQLPGKNTFRQTAFSWSGFTIDFQPGQYIVFRSEAERDRCYDCIVQAYQDWSEKFKDVATKP